MQVPNPDKPEPKRGEKGMRESCSKRIGLLKAHLQERDNRINGFSGRRETSTWPASWQPSLGSIVA